MLCHVRQESSAQVWVASRDGRGVVLRTSALQRDNSRAQDPAGNDNRPVVRGPATAVRESVDRLRRSTVLLVLASCVVAVMLWLVVRVRIDPSGAALLNLFVASLLLFSRMWWGRKRHDRIADAFGTVGLVAFGGMACGAIAMLELKLGFPLTDGMLMSWDRAIGLDGISILVAEIRQGQWLFSIMAPVYKFTIPAFFTGLVVLSFLGQRLEAWRAAFCFVGTLLTTCLISIFTPAKGLGIWASDELVGRLPPGALRAFWAHFDEFYFEAQPVLRLQGIDGVISFPSFHSIVGFMTWAMWRKNSITSLPAAAWLTFMLLATFPYGGHYAVDLLAGFFVWLGWFAMSRLVETGGWRQPRPAVALVSDGPLREPA